MTASEKELAAAQKRIRELEMENAFLKSRGSASGDGVKAKLYVQPLLTSHGTSHRTVLKLISEAAAQFGKAMWK